MRRFWTIFFWFVLPWLAHSHGRTGDSLDLGGRGQHSKKVLSSDNNTADSVGFTWIGANWLDNTSGRFLSFDPLGHDSSYSGYSFCNGNPIGLWDPDGRFGRGVYEGLTSGTLPATSSGSFDSGYWLGSVLGGGAEGLQGGASITANTFSFGGTDALGLTQSGQYQGWEYTSSQILSTVGRESLIGAATLGSMQLARAGSEASLYAYQGLQVVNAGRSGYASGTGIDQVSQGNNWGWLGIAGGTLGLTGGFTIAAAAPELNNLNVAQNHIFSAAARELPNLNFSTPQNAAVFYSGPGNRQLALGFADTTGAMPIDRTLGGMRLNQLDLYQSVSQAQADFIWSGASRSYASQVSGTINMFIEGASQTRVFYTVEKPILESNAAVTDWVFHPRPHVPVSTPKP